MKQSQSIEEAVTEVVTFLESSRKSKVDVDRKTAFMVCPCESDDDDDDDEAVDEKGRVARLPDKNNKDQHRHSNTQNNATVNTELNKIKEQLTQITQQLKQLLTNVQQAKASHNQNSFQHDNGSGRASSGFPRGRGRLAHFPVRQNSGQVVFNQHHNPGACYTCGAVGHFSRNCPGSQQTGQYMQHRGSANGYQNNKCPLNATIGVPNTQVQPVNTQSMGVANTAPQGTLTQQPVSFFFCYIQSTGKLAGTNSNGPEEVPKMTTAESDVNVNNQKNGASDVLSIARRGIPRVSGIYVEGHIEGVDLTFTVDTGASATILSTAILAEIPAERRPKIDTEKRPHFIGPTGSAIEILGKVKMKMTIGELEINREVSVANLHECLLGADILLGLAEGPFDFFLSENRLSWNGFSIPCIQVTSAVPLKGMCAFKCTIAGHSEMLVDALVQSNEQNAAVSRTLHQEDVLIEPDSNFCDRNRLMVAASLVQLDFTKVVKVRVMNPFPNDVEVQEGEVMAEATHFDQAIPLLNECDSTLGEGTEVARQLPMANEKDDIEYLKQC